MTSYPDEHGAVEKFDETERNIQAGGQKAPRTRKSSGAVANFGVSGYFSHEKGGTWTTSRLLPRKLPSPYCCRPARLTSPGCRNWPERTAPTHTNQYGHACYSRQSGACRPQQRCGSRPRAGRRRFNLAPPFHHRGLECLGMPTAENLHLKLGATVPCPCVQVLCGEKRRPSCAFPCNMPQTCVHLLCIF